MVRKSKEFSATVLWLLKDFLEHCILDQSPEADLLRIGNIKTA